MESCKACRELGSDLAHHCFCVILLSKSSPIAKNPEVEWEVASRIKGMGTEKGKIWILDSEKMNDLFL